MRRMRAAIPTPEEFAAAVSRETLDRIKKNVMDYIRGLEAGKAPLRRKRGIVLRRMMNYLTWSAAAFLVAANVWVWHTPADVPPQPEVATKVERPTPEQPQQAQAPSESPLKDVFDKLTTAPEAYACLKERFKIAESVSDFGELEHLISLCRLLIEKFPDTREGLECRKLISRCYSAMGEMGLARAAYVEFAQYAGKRFGSKLSAGGWSQDTVRRNAEKRSADLLLAEVMHFYKLGDYGAACSFSDALTGSFGDTEQAWRARALAGEVLYYSELPEAAVKVFKSVIGGAPASTGASVCRSLLPSALFNAGRHVEAVETCLQYSKAASTAEEKASASYKAAILTLTRGKGHREEAIGMLAQVVKQCSDTRHAKMAGEMLAELTNQMTGEIQNDLLTSN